MASYKNVYIQHIHMAIMYILVEITFFEDCLSILNIKRKEFMMCSYLTIYTISYFIIIINSHMNEQKLAHQIMENRSSNEKKESLPREKWEEKQIKSKKKDLRLF